MRLTGHHDDERAEPGGAGALDEREGRGRVAGKERRPAVPEGGRDGALAARRHLEQVEHEPLALLGEGARGGGQAFALGNRTLEHGQPLTCKADKLVLVAAAPWRGRGGPRLELAGVGLRRLTPQRDALSCGPQAVERGSRAFTRPRRIGELLLGRRAGRQQ